ncbi:MAG: serine/threonine-protein kinase [Acidobacteriota bacterium]
MIPAEQWQKIQQLFDELVELPPPARRLELERLDGSDAPLRAELEALLAANELAGDYLETPPNVASEAPLPSSPEPYRLLRRIGRGGSSTVYLADRADDTYRKRVAIKILEPGRADSDLLRRFRNERQILASLTHPYIAELYDGGSTPDGLPYFVMEYIEGLPVDAYCVQYGLGVTDRLRLFGRICEAVQHAHQSLVIHRDIKPSNILVTEDGTPKLLDFGIAKLLNPELAAPDLTPTVTWQRPLTPHYASPEQIQGQLITTRSDVYSLGVLLYLLLAGRLPEHRRHGELERVLTRETLTRETPRPPSLEVLQPASDPPGPSCPLELRPAALSRRLAGDLDTIVLKTLRKEPGRRYGSVEELGADLRRHREGRPVLARRDSLTYRAAKFVRRNRLVVAVASLSLAALITLSVFLALQSERWRRERDQARAERDKSSQMLQFMQGVFSQADPFTSGDAEPTALEILDRSVEALETLEEQPQVRLHLALTFAQIFLEQGRLQRAETLLREAHSLHRDQPDAEPALATEILGLLGIALRKQGKFEAAEATQQQALALRREVFGEDSLEVGWTWNDLAVIYRHQGRYAEAEALYLKFLELQQRRLGARDEAVGTTYNNLGTLYLSSFRYREAEEAYRQALDIRRRALGADHLYAAFSRANLALALIQRRRLTRAAPHLEQSREALQNIFRAEHPEVLRVDLLEAQRLRLLGNAAEAEARLRTLLDRVPASPASRNDPRSRIRWELAFVHQQQGELEAAEALVRSILDDRRRTLGEQHPQTVLALDRLAEVKLHQRDWQQALSLQQAALEGLERRFGASHPRLAVSLSRLATAHFELGTWDQAEPLFRRAQQLAAGNPDRQPDADSEILARHGEALLSQQRFSEAEPLLQQSLEALAPAFAGDHPLIQSRRAALERCRRSS